MSNFSKRHYEAIATLLRMHQPNRLYDDLGHLRFNDLVDSFVEMFEVDNALFDASRFRDWVHGETPRGMAVSDARKRNE